MSGEEVPAGERLNVLMAEAGLGELDPIQTGLFEEYLSLFVRWNAKVNLTSVRDVDGILSRHFIESIACARALPPRIATLLDFGSGGGFPGIPIAICRPEISVLLAESQGKKAAFLQEAVRTLGIPAKVYAGRAELLRDQFDCVTLRAVDRMAEAVSQSAALVATGGWLALMTSRGDQDRLQAVAGARFSWADAVDLPGSDERLLVLGQGPVSLPA
jgi:16S rRNA (guanine527-N7)-methyltransferase